MERLSAHCPDDFRARRRVDSFAVFAILHPVRNNLLF